MSGAVNRLLARTTIHLFGRVLCKIDALRDDVSPGWKSPEYLGHSSILETMKRDDLYLAHILAYSYLGSYVPLRVPAVFVVITGGKSVFADETARTGEAAVKGEAPGKGKATRKGAAAGTGKAPRKGAASGTGEEPGRGETPGMSEAPGTGEKPGRGEATRRVVDPGQFGLAHFDARSTTFAADLRFWTYKQSEQTIRLDPASGTLQQLVIDAETGGPHGRRRVDLVGQDSSFTGRFGGGNH
jgi:hypothetical protein